MNDMIEKTAATHSHACMRCGERFFCLSPAGCAAGDNVMPRVVVQGPDGPQVFEHVCVDRKDVGHSDIHGPVK